MSLIGYPQGSNVIEGTQDVVPEKSSRQFIGVHMLAASDGVRNQLTYLLAARGIRVVGAYSHQETLLYPVDVGLNLSRRIRVVLE